MQETCIQVAYTTIQVSRKRNMSDDGDDNLAVASTTIALSALVTKINEIENVKNEYHSIK